jgi:RNA polymerase sigma factor (sigma-70 family)
MTTKSPSPVLRLVRRLARGPAAVRSDDQLLEGFLRGEADALEALVERHGPMVLGTVRRLLRDSNDAEDAFQATFLVFLRKAGSIRRGESLGPWLYGVAYRVARKAQAGAARRRALLPRPAEARSADPGDEAARRDLRRVLDEEVSRLPARYRDSVVLCYFEGRSKEEVARQLGCPAGTVSAWLARAREQLRGRLVRRGVALSAGLLGAALAPGAASAALPPELLRSTVEGLLPTAATGATAGLASGPAAALAKGVMRAMFLTKLKVVASVALALGVVGAGAGSLRCWQSRAAAPAVARDVVRVADKDDRPAEVAGRPKGWFGGSAKIDEYEVGRDRKEKHGGKASAFVRMKGVEDTDFGTIGQAFKADAYRGKRVRLSAWLKTKDVAGGAALWMRVDGTDKTLTFDNMMERRVKGDNDWARYEVVLDVPEAAKHITFGLLVAGKGQAWVDDFKLEAVDPKKVKSTNLLKEPIPQEVPDADVPDKPVNLGFEEE